MADFIKTMNSLFDSRTAKPVFQKIHSAISENLEHETLSQGVTTNESLIKIDIKNNKKVNPLL